MVKIILAQKAAVTEHYYSIEAGKADGHRHFDHHGEWEGNPSPCNDNRVPVVPDQASITITHMDADTYVGLLRMLGRGLPNILVDLVLMERIDNEGSKGLTKKSPTLQYMVGVTQLARKVGFPRTGPEPIDVTNHIEAMMSRTEDEIISFGKKAIEASEKTYRGCKTAGGDVVALWEIGPDDPFDPSRPYEDGVEVVVVYRKHFNSVSIYCDPESQWEFAGKTIAGITFQGHPKACGSPRGEEFDAHQALAVYKTLAFNL